jgi:hypothetical protein
MNADGRRYDRGKGNDKRKKKRRNQDWRGFAGPAGPT